MFELIENFDKQLFLWLNGMHSPLLDDVMYYVSAMWIFTPFYLFLVWLLVKTLDLKKSIIAILFIGLLIGFADQTSTRVKHAVKRYRPTHNLEIQHQVHTVNDYKGGVYGFFSGHASNSFGIAMYLLLLLQAKRPYIKWWLLAWAGLTSYSRIYLGVHYPSDILLGMLSGIFWGYVVYKLVNYVFKKYIDRPILD